MPRFVNSLEFTVHSGEKTVNREPLTVNKRRRRLGFTLIEILVAITIIATLAGAVILTTGNARDKGKDTRRKNDLKAINSAIIAYRADKSHWPPDNIYSTTLEYASYSSADWLDDIHPYINKMPNDPVINITNEGDQGDDEGETGSCQTANHGYFYCYVLSSDKKTYTLWAQLENTNDTDIYSKSSARCTATPPTGSSLNYCLKASI